MMRLNVKAFALTCGILWGLTLFLMTWWMIVSTGATNEPTWIGKFYFGYRVNAVGSFIGLAWALPDGFIGGAIFAWFYNLLAGRADREA